MEFPPPNIPPPNFPPPQGFHPRPFHPGHNNFHHKPFHFKSYKHGMQVQDDFDGKRLRKSVMRKTVDYNSSIIKALEVRLLRFGVFHWFPSFFSLFIFRTEFGKEIIATEERCNLKTVTFRTWCRLQVTWIIRVTRSRHDSLRRQRTKCDVQSSL